LSVVVGWAWHALFVLCWDSAQSWILRDVTSLGHSGLRKDRWNDEGLRFVFARARDDLDRLHRTNRVAEPIIVVLRVDPTAWYAVHARLVLLVLRLLCHIEQASDLICAHFRLLVLVILWFGMWIIQVYWHDFLRYWVSKSGSTFISGLPCVFEPVTDIIVTWSWFFSSLFDQLRGDHSSLLLRNKGARAAIGVRFNWTRVVLTDARVRLLKVNVDSDGAHIVQRIFLVEWQTEVALVLHLGSSDVLLLLVWLVLARSYIDTRVSCQHIGILNESFLLRGEVFFKELTVKTNHSLLLNCDVFFNRLRSLLVGAGTWVLVI